MGLKIDLSGRVQEGKMIWDLPQIVKDTFAQFEGKKLLITVQLFTRKRSYLQNRYYHGVVVEILYEAFKGAGTGFGRDEVHQMLKDKFLRRNLIDKNGEVIGTYGDSTTKLSTVEFMEFIADVQKWASESYGIYIPDPNEELVERDEVSDQAFSTS